MTDERNILSDTPELEPEAAPVAEPVEVVEVEVAEVEVAAEIEAEAAPVEEQAPAEAEDAPIVAHAQHAAPADDVPAEAPADEPGPEPAPEPEIELPDPTAPVSPEDTAEIDVQAIESKLSDPGSTQSFAPITDDLIDTDATFDAGTSATLRWGARSDVGCVRSHNEDSYLVASPLFCICDGMGGHAAGEVASAIAVETIAKMAPTSANAAQLGAAIEAANTAIIDAARNGIGRPGMGCTATAAYIEGTTLAIAHVGDSRAYLLHEGTLIRITRDHSYVEELVDAGEITADEARVHPNRSVITRALGSDPAMYADHFTINIEQGDRLILCSDGLSGMIPDGEIERIATMSSTAQICTDNLVDAALAAGGGDNVTVVAVDIADDGSFGKMQQMHRRNALIGLICLVAVVLIAGAIATVSITNSVFLGVKDDAVAIYKGVPGSLFGLELHWLEDETSVQLVDLPEDTQSRLREGIPVASLDEASETVSRYRKQIDEEQSKQVENALTIMESTGGAGAQAGADANAQAGGSNGTSSAAPSSDNPASAVAATEASGAPASQGGGA